ncbi:uncharacterized protein UV8b_04430 [Ustilaginoidea virens]|uniref:UBL3-like ubiquitin domain-containing protein n=1 Tax=Ustilaginoidea virens TaxID=1159556 RepID=A0A8E5HS74_USTVR|nr:uncharacterized protein UV8b_04430 [Ustilaginoidea virens]QUC20189.1 hypothetical protein UV8b_04430 [Ustilaginoidea virens]
MDSTMSGGNDGKSTPLLGHQSQSDSVGEVLLMENMPPIPTATATGDKWTACTPADASNDTEKDAATAEQPPAAVDAAPATNLERTAAKDQGAAEAVAKGKEKEHMAPAPPAKERRNSVLAIGPAQDDITTTPDPCDGPVCNITLLLTSGSRHPYKIDGKYLTRRNVVIPDATESGLPDPFSISIYTLKELILREWRSDWEAKPASPSSIRLIHFGKLLDDKEPLKKYQLSTENPNVVHMSIRPQDLDEEEPKSGSKSLAGGGSDGQRSRSNGRCCVIL